MTERNNSEVILEGLLLLLIVVNLIDLLIF